MEFIATDLKDAYLIRPTFLEDERGFFARISDVSKFKEHGIEFQPVQCSISFNRHQGTLRGMHFQVEPYAEAKLVRCTHGIIYDVIVDIRPESATHMKWSAFTLDSQKRESLWVPRGFAHGFQTLTDNAEVFYQISTVYNPSAAQGIRWDDPAFKIAWPLPDPIMSQRDREFPKFTG